ncbi:OmpA family protein [Echinimonas agarilytica]|uniref:OmpA family protein n=1 Tax=Echinimonas agarilytica TaxID=1215918 RepID=A0AA41W6M6_9GAMM|nr:OmpA family protein [Echinimonas agarilytica]MCM2679544.1 OmpA family protein [Echinimonas agarilytica]
MRTLICSLLALSAVGCASTPWPQEGRGGMAEHESNLLGWLDSSSDTPMGPEHGLKFEMTIVKHHLDLLVLEGAELCFPASVAQARLREQRMMRELQGGLALDAANDIEIQQHFLHTLEERLDHVKRGGACKPTGIAGMSSSQLIDGLHPLLNSNNQFAFDSSELTPAYRDQLNRVVPLLQSAELAMVITGHTDIQGSGNKQLSQQRAQTVASYLQSQGVSQQRMLVRAQGSSAPYEDGNSVEHFHSNRRVTISLIEPAMLPGGRQ